MMRRNRVVLFAALALVFVGGLAAQSALPAVTKILVADLDCAGCGNRIGKQLQTVPGVAKVEMNVEARTMFVTPAPKTALSPRALWEAVEKAKKTPEKLEGPSGTFTEKPQS